MMSNDSSVTRQDILDYAKKTGNESAANLLLLFGPGFFAGDFQEYNELLYILTASGNNKPQNP